METLIGLSNLNYYTQLLLDKYGLWVGTMSDYETNKTKIKEHFIIITDTDGGGLYAKKSDLSLELLIGNNAGGDTSDCVKKIGDTMTGALKMSNTNLGTDSNIVISNPKSVSTSFGYSGNIFIGTPGAGDEALAMNNNSIQVRSSTTPTPSDLHLNPQGGTIRVNGNILREAGSTTAPDIGTASNQFGMFHGTARAARLVHSNSTTSARCLIAGTTYFDPTEGTETNQSLRVIDGMRWIGGAGEAGSTTQGECYAEIGNNKEIGTLGNMRGYLRLYSSNGNYSQIGATGNLSASNTIYLPTTGGTLALSSEIPTDYLPLTAGSTKRITGNLCATVDVKKGTTPSATANKALIFLDNTRSADGTHQLGAFRSTYTANGHIRTEMSAFLTDDSSSEQKILAVCAGSSDAFVATNCKHISAYCFGTDLYDHTQSFASIGWVDGNTGILRAGNNLAKTTTNGAKGELRLYDEGTHCVNIMPKTGTNLSSDITVIAPSSAGTLTVTSSDIRLKDNINDCSISAIDKLNQIKIHNFNWKESGDYWECGYIANELKELDEHFILEGSGGENEDGTINPLCIDDFYISAYQTKAIQELSAEIETLKAELETLKKA